MKILALVIIILLLTTAFGGYFVYYEITLSQPKSSVSTLPYSTDASYSYVAQLAPNLLYNKTSISNGQGTLFSNLIKSINVTFLYSISSENTSNINLSCTYTELLVTSSWNKTLLEGSVNAQKDGATQASISKNFSIDVATISNLAQTIQSETGVSVSKYAVVFVPSITGGLSSNGVTGNFLADPVFNFTFSSTFGSSAGVITPSNPTIRSSGSILGSIPLGDSPPNLMYYISFITLGGSAIALVVTSLFYSKSSKHQVTKQSVLERKLSQYQEIISATDTPPNRRRAISIVSLEDLVKIADTMGKPVLRFLEKEKSVASNQFYVLDGETCYLFAPLDSQ